MFDLMKARRFAPLFWTQFFSAFNDNILKNAIIFLILFTMTGSDSEAYVTFAGAVFILPFFFLSALGGQLADSQDKAIMAQRLKLIEIVATFIAVTGFALHSLPILFVSLFIFGCIAALFGPIKYGILPDHLELKDLPAGNALIEAATFIAILLGTIIGGMISKNGGSPIVFAALLLSLSVFCYFSSRFIPKTGAADKNLKVDLNIIRSTWQLLSDLWSDTRLWRTGVMVSLFWLIGAVAMSLMPSLIKNTMGGDTTVVSIYLAIFAISIGLGSAFGSFLSSGRIILLPVPIAAVFMGVFALDLAFTLSGIVKTTAILDASHFFANAKAWRIGFDLAGLAFAGGVFIVPAFAANQHWAPKESRARVIAAGGVLSAAFMVLGGVFFGILQKIGCSFSQLFMVLAALCFISAVWIFKIMPTSAFRDLLSIIFKALYRTEIIGFENIAKAGPNAVIALNHVSFADGGLALSILDKDPVFAIDHGIAQRWWVKPFVKMTRAMPLDPSRPLATRSLINAVKAGETLVIFPEGRLTVTGSLMKVYDGVGLIAEKAGAKVIPVRIEGLEATIFSRLNRLQVQRRWFPKVRVTILEPVDLIVPEELKGKARRQAAGTQLYQIMSDMIFKTTPIDRSVFQSVVEAAKVHGKSRMAVEDPITGGLSYKRLLIGARVLGTKFMPLVGERKAIGVMLPNANGAAVTILGLMSANRVPAMINFSAGASSILAACKAAEITTILSSRGFIEKAKLQPLLEQLQTHVKFVFLEDIRTTVTFSDKISAMLNHEKPLATANGDDRAAILFTSGSEGTPKGVVLSHKNMLANTAQAAARIDFGRQDKVFNVLPVFHSFGLTVGLILPLVSGVPVYLYPSPLHYRIVPELVYGSNSTILFGTDTFLTGYARSAHAYDFRSLRYILAGAEPVKDTTRRTYMEKFGLRILEGYGVTETAPVLAINTPMFNKFGTVGRAMPGMETRLEKMPGVDEGGRLHVRGPNIMLGYLKVDKPGVLEPVIDGWHDTGDIVTIDEMGFITIKGRAKRFAKIAGEMVSLAAVEVLASECWTDAMSAVASVPDAKKGERLILVTNKKGATRMQFQAFAKSKGASELMMPAEIMIVDEIPVLGSGKLDFVGVAKLVEIQMQIAA
jgi:acyl-[acyl-carrier-protein]-phospholipid O-acyltransferase / long-chain-fatty-acid--[acyl-carrier-protein] ligase